MIIDFYTTADGVRLNYRIQGEGEQVLLFIHGWGGNQLSFVPTIEKLKAPYKIVSYDQRGFGESSIPADGYTVDNLASDLAGLIEHLNLNRVVLVGWSMGGLAALTYLEKYGDSRVAGIVLVDINVKILSDENYKHGFYDGTYTLKEFYEDLQKMSSSFVNFIREMPEKANMTLYDEAARTVFVNRVVEQNSLLPTLCLWIALSAVDLTNAMKGLKIPALFCHGGTSTYCPPKAKDHAMSLIQTARCAEFPECSHFIPIERPEKFAEEIDNFTKYDII